MPNNTRRPGRPSPRRFRILKVGVTGGIGSGKSTVCRMFEESGVPVLYADRIAIEIEETHPAIKNRLKKLLGEHSFRTDGKLNRSYISSILFSDKKLRSAVQRLVHPAVIKETNRRIAAQARLGTPLVVVEAALLFESGFHRQLDSIIVVEAREDLRLRRVMERDGVKSEHVRKRMSAQWPVERKLRLADYVLGNNDTVEQLSGRVDFLISILRELAQRK